MSLSRSEALRLPNTVLDAEAEAPEPRLGKAVTSTKGALLGAAFLELEAIVLGGLRLRPLPRVRGGPIRGF